MLLLEPIYFYQFVNHVQNTKSYGSPITFRPILGNPVLGTVADFSEYFSLKMLGLLFDRPFSEQIMQTNKQKTPTNNLFVAVPGAVSIQS